MRSLRTRHLAVGLGLLLSAVTLHATDVFRWRGPHGTVHVAQSPPLNQAYEVIDPITGAVRRRVQAPPTAQELAAAAAARAQAAQAAAAAQARLQADTAFLARFPTLADIRRAARARLRNQAASIQLDVAAVRAAEADLADALQHLAADRTSVPWKRQVAATQAAAQQAAANLAAARAARRPIIERALSEARHWARLKGYDLNVNAWRQSLLAPSRTAVKEKSESD